MPKKRQRGKTEKDSIWKISFNFFLQIQESFMIFGISNVLFQFHAEVQRLTQSLSAM